MLQMRLNTYICFFATSNVFLVFYRLKIPTKDHSENTIGN